VSSISQHRLVCQKCGCFLAVVEVCGIRGYATLMVEVNCKNRSCRSINRIEVLLRSRARHVRGRRLTSKRVRRKKKERFL
jgi:hypothetical protein